MQENNRCLIICSGSSIRENLWDIPVHDLPIWNEIKNEITFSTNWSTFFFNPTIALYSDYQFYYTEKEKLDKLPMVVSIDDDYYRRKGSVKIGNNVHLIKGSNEYHGEDSWKQGFYSKELTGIWAINLALRCGFDKIFCLGLDGTEINSHTHFYDDNPKIGRYQWAGSEQYGVGKDERGYYRTGVYNNPKTLNDFWFGPLKEERDKIINVSPQSAINTFPKWSYEQFYKYLKDNPVKINQDEIRQKISNLIRQKSCYS